MLQTLTAEAETVRCFVEVLQLEQNALKSGKTEELADFAEKKSQYGITLKQLSAQRNTLLGASGFDIDRAGIEAWSAKNPSEKRVNEAWASIISLASEAQELNRLNGELIKLHMQYNSKALEALRGGHSALELYGPDGQSQTLGNRRINDAV
ncbi:MAG: flagellar protein FlgN [Betaproteobacteria bacterium]